MKQDGVGKLKAYTIYSAARIFGTGAYKQTEAELIKYKELVSISLS